MSLPSLAGVAVMVTGGTVLPYTFLLTPPTPTPMHGRLGHLWRRKEEEEEGTGGKEQPHVSSFLTLPPHPFPHFLLCGMQPAQLYLHCMAVMSGGGGEWSVTQNKQVGRQGAVGSVLSLSPSLHAWLSTCNLVPHLPPLLHTACVCLCVDCLPSCATLCHCPCLCLWYSRHFWAVEGDGITFLFFCCPPSAFLLWFQV